MEHVDNNTTNDTGTNKQTVEKVEQELVSTTSELVALRLLTPDFPHSVIYAN